MLGGRMRFTNEAAGEMTARGVRILAGIVVLLLTLATGCAAVLAGGAFDVAVDAFERGDYKAAIGRLEEILRRGADSARVRTLLGWSYFKLGDIGRARTEFEQALRLDTRDANALYAHEGLGWVAYRTGDHDRALVSFAESLRLSPGYHHAHDGLAWAYLAKGDLIRAEANFLAALDRAPGDLDARRGLGFVASRRGDHAKAVERFHEVLQENTADTLTRSALAWAHYYKGDYAAARPVFVEVMRREPTWTDPLLGVAWIAERQNRREEAKAGFRIAFEKSAVYVAAADSATSLKPLLVGRPEWVDLWREFGWALYHQRAFTLAEAEFRSLLGRHPDDPDALRGLGFALYAQRRYRDAIAPLESALASGAALPPVREQVEIPGVPGVHTIVSDATSTLAWSHYQAGNLRQALELFREVTSRQPDWADAWSGLGWTLAKSGDRTEAERAFRRSLAARPGYPDAVTGLGALGKRTP